MSVELTESLFSKAAGWEAMKRARAYLEQDQVLSSNWTEPILKGVVQAGEISFRAGLVIKGPIDIENICSCRESREWGTICAHSVAVGLHWLNERVAGVSSAESSNRRSANVSSQGNRTSAGRMLAARSSGLLREAGGEPAELFIILPPNFEQTVLRGKVMLVLEAQWSGGRCPLNALPKLRPFAFSEQDSKLIDQLESLSNGETPAMLQLETKDFASLLPTLAGHPNVTLGKSSAVTITRTLLKVPLRATLEPNGEIVLSLKEKAASPTQLGSGWIWHERTIQPLTLPPTIGDVFRGSVRVTRAQVPQFLSQHWPQLQAAGGVEANFTLEDFTLEPQAPKFLLELKGGLAQLTGLLQCAYGPRIMTVGVTSANEGVWLPDPDVPTRYSTRDSCAEQAALAHLKRSGFNGPDADGRLKLNGQNAVLNFFAREYPRLEREWSVTLEERLERSTAQNIERIEPKFQITPSGVQWFDLGVVFESSGGERFSAADIQRLILSGQGHTRLRNGKMAVIDTGAVEELQEVLLDCSPQQHGQGYRISSTQAGFLESTLKQHAGWKVQAPTAWRDRAAKQSGEAKLECPPLGDLESVLRSYQKHGVAWLHFLQENGFGGILADEMGLGKTLQVLALFNSTRNTEHGTRSDQSNASPGVPRSAFSVPYLVVCPTSLVFNWVAEAKKFTPKLRVLALHGPERHPLFEQILQSDVVVTSYALIRRDADKYRDLEFDTVVLDEAQHIKNRQTQNAQAVKAVRSKHRLVLTGTPMENSVLDLWSIFDFLMPGYLGAAQDFRERYELPITRDKNSDAAVRLSRRLRPFILRRLKRDVAADLPAKLEQVSFCEMTSDQRAVYQQVIEASRREVLDAVGAQGLAKSRMVVLSALLRLRQVCCDLRLLKLEGVEPTNASGKLELFGELLEEVIDGGHRVLVFSQFVSMLTLLKEQLTAEGIEYCYLDGSTTNRGEVVERFQRTATIPVFLISLKAGGVGLNLTGADTVIHFDPWWNPAVEDQATDRAHRIGQTRVVTSYKLITRDTVEEKILLLQQKKRDTISWRFPDEDKEIKRGAQLIVRESQTCQFIYLGQFGDTFGPGKHTLQTGNIPILSTLKGWKYGFESPFKADIYYVNTRLFTGNKWGTSNPVMLRDQDFGIVRVRAFGTYDFKVVDVKTFLKEVAGTDHQFRLDEFSDAMRSRMVSVFTDALASAKVPVLDVASRYSELGDALLPIINPTLVGKYGIEMSSFIVENVSVPPEVEGAIDKRSSMQAIGNLNDYVKFQMAEAMGKGGEGGGMANTAAQLGAGLAMGQQMMAAMGSAQTTPSAGGAPPPLPGAATAGSGLPELLSPGDVANTLGVSEGDVLASLADGSLKGKKIGSTWRITRQALEEFLKS